MRFVKMIGVLALSLPTIANSAPQTFNCEFQAGRRGIIPQQVQFVIDQDRGSATVYDPIIAELYNAPLVAKLTKKRDGRYWLRWRIKKLPVTVVRLGDGIGLPSVKTKASVFFEVWLNPDSNQARMRSKGSRSTYSTRVNGSCGKK